MNNRKAIIVTVILTAMLLVIELGLAYLSELGFAVLTGLLAVYGIMRGGYDFCRWLCADKRRRVEVKEDKLEVPPVFDVAPVFDATDFDIDAIIEETVSGGTLR